MNYHFPEENINFFYLGDCHVDDETGHKREGVWVSLDLVSAINCKQGFVCGINGFYRTNFDFSVNESARTKLRERGIAAGSNDNPDAHYSYWHRAPGDNKQLSPCLVPQGLLLDAIANYGESRKELYKYSKNRFYFDNHVAFLDLARKDGFK